MLASSNQGIWLCASGLTSRVYTDYEELALNKDDEEWSRLWESILANNRGHAGYFSCRTDRTIEEVDVVRNLHESLVRHNQAFFDSPRSLGANDPPDCEAVSHKGSKIGIEVTELVDSASLQALNRNQPTPWEPLSVSEVCELIRKRITRKDNASGIEDGRYEQYVLIIYTDESRIDHVELMQFVKSQSFGKTKLIDRCFLLFSYDVWEEGCPYVELRVSRTP